PSLSFDTPSTLSHFVSLLVGLRFFHLVERGKKGMLEFSYMDFKNPTVPISDHCQKDIPCNYQEEPRHVCEQYTLCKSKCTSIFINRNQGIKDQGSARNRPALGRPAQANPTRSEPIPPIGTGFISFIV